MDCLSLIWILRPKSRGMRLSLIAYNLEICDRGLVPPSAIRTCVQASRQRAGAC